MAKMDIKKLLAELHNELNLFVGSPDKWVEFLRSASWNYKYPFQNQLLIYSQRPDATACADFDVWNKRLQRYVVRGAVGIALLNDTGDKVYYVFDVSDTRSNSHEELKLWGIQEDAYEDLLEKLNGDNLLNCASVEDAVVGLVDIAVNDVGTLYLPEDFSEGSAASFEFYDFVKHSSCFAALSRCGFVDAANVYANKYLNDVSRVFTSDNDVISVGTAVSAISKMVLREIERNVKLVEQTKVKPIENNNLEDVTNELDIQTGRGISDSGYSADRTIDSENRENGDVTPEIPSSQQTEPVYDTSDAGRVGEAFDRDRGTGENSGGAIGSELIESEHGSEEDIESVRVDAALELGSVDGRGDSEEGTDLPLDDVLFPTVEEQLEIIENSVESEIGFALSQEDIDCVLAQGSGFVDGKYRIYDYCLEKHSAKERAEFLKNEYGMGGGTRVLSDGTWGDSWTDAKGLRISRSGHSMSNPDVLLAWNKVQKRIGELIKAGRYLNEKELAEYPSYKEELKLRIARISVSEEFKNVIIDYNAFLREHDGESEQLNQYVLVAGCASALVDGHKKTNLGENGEEFILPLMRDALNTIIASVSPLKERAEVVLESLQRDVFKDLEPSFDNKNIVEEEYVWIPKYKVGDLFFTGANKYSVVEVSDESVFLSNVEFELDSLDLSKDDFEKIIRENPSNKHLLRKVPVEDYNAQINHAIAVVDEIKRSIEPVEEEPGYDVVDLLRVGDFFEVRGDAAVRVAEDLDLVITSRTIDGEKVPMVGFPVHVLDAYTKRAQSHGFVMREVPEVELSEPSERVRVENIEESPKEVKRNALIARNYDFLYDFAPEVLNGDFDYLRFESEGLEPLTIENLGDNLISVMHSFVQNGDLMRDPDVVISVDHANKTATAVSYEMSSMGAYKEYMDLDTGEVLDEAGQKETNSFLADWFKNIVSQGYVLARGEKSNGDSAYYDKEGNEISEEVPEGVSEKFHVRLYRPFDEPNVVKAYVAEVNSAIEKGHIIEDEREVYEYREAAENAVDNFNTVFNYDEEFRNETLARVPEPVVHRYFSTQRPVGPGTYPKAEGIEPVNIVNFDEREFVQEIDRAAWGYIEFSRPLPLKQVEDYELVKAPFGDKQPDAVTVVERGVGELTGEVISKENVELREGDIVEFTNNNLSGSTKHIGVVNWNEGYEAYVVNFDDLAGRFLSQVVFDIKKLGSIYEDKEESAVKRCVKFHIDDKEKEDIFVYVDIHGVKGYNTEFEFGVFDTEADALNACSDIKDLIKGDAEFNNRYLSLLRDMVDGVGKFSVRLALNNKRDNGIEVYVANSAIPCPETDIELVAFDDADAAFALRTVYENHYREFPEQAESKKSELVRLENNAPQRFAIRLRLDDDYVGGIDAYIEKTDVPCPETDIEISVYDTEPGARSFRSQVEYAIEDNVGGYRDKRYFELLTKKEASLEKELASLAPTVTCVWSEHEGFEDGKKYSLVEFNSLMKQLDAETVKLKEEYRARNDYYPYFKTKFRIHFPDGYEYEGRQDVGDGDGSLLDHVRKMSEHNLARLKEDGYGGHYKGEELESAIKECEHFLSVYLPLLEEEVQKEELSYDKGAYDLGYGSLGNGTTVWNRADTDKETNDYRTVAHISVDGTVKFYQDNLPEGVRAEIRDRAVGFSADFLKDVLAMSEEKFKFWYFNQMSQAHPTFIPGKDFQMQDYVKCYHSLHEEGFVRDVSVPLIVQLEEASKVLSKASEETHKDIVEMVNSGEISLDDISEALKDVDGSQINSIDDVYNVLARKFVDDVPADAPKEKGTNFKIKNFDLGVGGPKEKYGNNIAAIKLLKQLEKEERQATPEEQEVLHKYVGWGGLANAFDPNKASWAKEYAELKEVLTEDEYNAASESTMTAFFTPPVVINAVYDGLKNLGFKRGNILEPSCGVGNFFGMLPDAFASSNLYGVELDSISGRIAKQLYPDAKIAVKGYEETRFKDSFFDVAIGNVPFNDFKVNDKDYNKLNFLIHDYFFAKTLDKVRSGGVIAFITSKGTLDKQNSTVRKYIAQRAELLGAIRLPDNTFLANAGTGATSDIIFLKKRDKAIEIEPDWVHLGLTEDGIPINSYFIEHPEMVLGTMEMDRKQYGREDSTCVPFPDRNLDELLKGAVQNIKGEISERARDFDEAVEDTPSLVKTIEADPDVRNFSFTIVDGDIYYRVDNEMVKQEFNHTQEQRVRGLIELRDCLRHLIDLQRYNHSDAEIEAEQSRLNKLYDTYTAKYGLINSRGNSLAFDDDSSYYLLCSLENVNEKGELISKADMFTKRTIKPHVAVKSVGTASEALSVCISEKAKVDLDFMSSLADMPKKKIVEDLVGVIFRVPGAVDAKGEPIYVTSDEYLSGNVREKLKVAKEAAVIDGSFGVNVSALEQVLPKDLEPGDISLRLGSIWVPEDVVNEFMWQLLETPQSRVFTPGVGYQMADPYVKAHYNEINGSWTVENKNWYNGSVKASSTYGTRRMSAYDIIYNTLNLKTVEIYDYVEDENGKRSRVLNRNETVVAQQKQELIKNEFVNWVWSDPERRQRLVRLYNDRFNSIRPREYNGEHLVFEGMNPDITLMEHQKNAVAHAIYGGNTLLAHEVGAGKTFEMAAIAMESKRLGLCTKSLVVVPKHLIGQWASEFYQLYPSANLLVASEKDFTPENRKKFCSRIATGDYDAVIISHSQFEKIPLSVETQERFLRREIEEVAQGIRELQASGEDRSSVKSLEKTKKSLKLRLEKLKDIPQDDVLTFEEMGIDKLFIDESHYFKNLFLYTKMRNVAGISQTEAKKSSDLYLKTQYLNEKTDSKGVVFATGTPISNSMVELFTIQRYLQPDMLKRNGLFHFDAWASTFGEVVTAVELAPEGTGYRAKTRFAKFYNIPELMSLFKMVADIRTANDLDLNVPDVEFNVIQAEPTAIQEKVVESLGERAKAVRNGGLDPTVDNMLKITNDGRLLGLDQRCFDPSLPDDESSKVNKAVSRIYDTWDKYKEDKLTQLVFSDLSTPNGKNEFSIYEDVKQKLIARGVPEEEIAFIHDAKTDAQKERLFAKVRAGDVRVLMGSTLKMGAGTNVQDKLIKSHDLDCPWRPSDLAQRLGRIVRQGNLQTKVSVDRYVTKGTFDAYLWQIIETKQKFISQIWTSKSPVRVAEDIDDMALSYAEIKSLCIKDPRIKEKMELDIDVAKLKLVKANFLSQKYRLEDDITLRYPAKIKELEQTIAGLKADIQTVASCTVYNTENNFSPMVVNGVTYIERKQAGVALLNACMSSSSTDKVEIGEYRGLKILTQYDAFTKLRLVYLKGELSYNMNLGESDTGNILRLDNIIGRFKDSLSSAEQELVSVMSEFETAKVEVKKDFAQEDELNAKVKRLDELDALLRLEEKGGASVDEVAADVEDKGSLDSVLSNAYSRAGGTSNDSFDEKSQDLF